jgi:hypothetical protein
MKDHYILLGGVSAVALWLWYDSLRGSSRILTHGSATLHAAIPYRFTYQTTYPIVATTPNPTMSDRQGKLRQLLVPSSAYAIEFKKHPGLVGGEYLLSFTAAPPRDTSVTIGTPLLPTAPGDAFDLKLVRVERMDGQAL